MSEGVRRARAEVFGAMLELEEPPALVAVDRALARRLGVDGEELWFAPSPGLDVAALVAPTEVHVSVTERCPAGCKGCYADARPDGFEPTFEELCERLRRLARDGVFRVAFGGGEASLRPDLPEIGAYAKELGLIPTVTTSGLGVTEARAEAFRVFAQVNVSLDGPAGVYEEVRGYSGTEVAERAARALVAAGVLVGINTVLTRHTMPELDAVAARALELGAGELQLLRFKPSGRGGLDYLAVRPTWQQIAELPATLRRLSEHEGLAVRVDCAMVPWVAADPDVDLEALRRFGVMGCEAGRSLMTTKADGAVGPCSFWGEAGTVRLDDDADVWRTAPVLERFRRYAADPPEPCASCPVRQACRGGCRIVAQHIGGDAFAPDPECPRVRAHEARVGKARCST